MTGRDWLELLLTLAQAPKGVTQRSVAQELGITKVEARRRLRSAVTAGLVVESILTPRPNPVAACSASGILRAPKRSSS
jgi:DNA-binding transcriptional regulator LsrR (DeoR family)